MAEDQIIVEYRAKIDKFAQDLANLEKSFRGIESTADKSGKKISDDTKKQGGLINDLKTKINSLTEARDRSNNPVAIQRYNKLIDDSTKKISQLTKATQQVTKETGGLSKILGSLGGQIAVAFSVGTILNVGKSIIDITAKFQKYEAVLTNTLGSNSAAKKALEDIQDFASKTPFSVDQLTESFVKLANQGFTPNVTQLRQLGDLASSTGKGFDQLSEAILDAQTGQFERLKEFGIKAEKQGDKVNFTFKGVRKEVDFTSSSIQKYILSLGDTKGVSGAMAAISGTLEGKISNLGDTYDQLLLTIGRNGNEGVSGAISVLSFLLEESTKSAEGSSSIFDRLIILGRALYDPYVDLAKTLGDLAAKLGLTSKAGSSVEFVFFLIEKAVKIATIPIRLFVQQVVTLIDLVTLNFDKVGDDFVKMGQIIATTDGSREQALNKTIDGIAKKIKAQHDEIEAGKAALLQEKQKADQSKKMTEDQIKEYERKFKALLDYIGKKQALETRLAKIADANQIELVTIERKYNQERIELLKKYGKTKTDEYQNLLVNEKQFDKDIDKIVVDGLAKKKAEEDKAANDQKMARIKAIQDTVKGNKDKNDALVKQDEETDAKEAARLKEHRANIRTILVDSIQITGDILNSIVQNKLNNDKLEIQSEQNKNQKQTDIQLAAIDKRQVAGEISEKAAIAQKEAIQARATQKDNALKLKAWKAQQTADIRTAEINAAVSIGKTFAVYGFTPVALIAAGAAAAEAAILIATIKSRKPPQFGKGGEIKGKSHTEGGEIIEAERGEFVVRKSAYQENKKLIKHINDGKPAEEYFMKDIASVMILKQKKQQAKENALNEAALKAISSKSIDLDHLERLVKNNKTVNLGNADQLASLIAKKIGNSNPEMK